MGFPILKMAKNATPEKMKYDLKKITYTHSTQSLEQERLSNTFTWVKTDHVMHRRRKEGGNPNFAGYLVWYSRSALNSAPLQSVTTFGIPCHTLQASATPHFHFSLFPFLSLLELFATMSGANRKYELRHIFNRHAVHSWAIRYGKTAFNWRRNVDSE